MKQKLSKKEVQEMVEEFFSNKNFKEKTPKEIKKIKKLAMSRNIPLKEKRKFFCKKCLNPFQGNEKIRIRKQQKTIECKSCGYVNRWKI